MSRMNHKFDKTVKNQFSIVYEWSFLEFKKEQYKLYSTVS